MINVLMRKSEDPRIIYVRNIDEVILKINEEYSSKFPILIRGIITSIRKPVNLSYEIKEPISLSEIAIYKVPMKVKNIQKTLNNGIESEIIKSPITINLDDYPPGKLTLGFASKENIDYYVRRTSRTISEKKKSWLRSAILVYDKTVLTPAPNHKSAYRYILTEDKKKKNSKAILKAYVLDG